MRRDFSASDLIVDGEPVGALSDHAALLAEIRLAPRRADFRSSAAGERHVSLP